jgi:hypothetical protein
MNVEEPAIAYGVHNSQLDELRNKLIATISKLTDIQLLTQCGKLLNITCKHEEVDENKEFEDDARAAFQEYKDYLAGKHKLKSEEEFWNEFYKG